MNSKQLVKHLNSLGITDAIADKNASVDGSPAVLLRWNGQEEYYTGFDIILPGSDPAGQPEYQARLIAKFATNK